MFLSGGRFYGERTVSPNAMIYARIRVKRVTSDEVNRNVVLDALDSKVVALLI